MSPAVLDRRRHLAAKCRPALIAQTSGAPHQSTCSNVTPCDSNVPPRIGVKNYCRCMATRLDTRVPPPVWTLGMAAAHSSVPPVARRQPLGCPEMPGPTLALVVEAAEQPPGHRLTYQHRLPHLPGHRTDQRQPDVQPGSRMHRPLIAARAEANAPGLMVTT